MYFIKKVLTKKYFINIFIRVNTFYKEDFMESYFDMLWLVLSAALVFIMQAGFAMVESGLSRAKNSANILMKNIADISVGAIAYFAIGWALMYGKDALGGIIGSDQFFLTGATSETYRDWFFQVVFAATAATIVSGAICERTKFSGYIFISLFTTAFIYTIPGHWVWSENGWLAAMGFHDFAGSTVVHSLGGWVALWSAIFVGPRIGKYIRRPDGSTKIMPITGHNLPLVGLGVFLLWFGWYGFNGGSTLSGTDPDISLVVTNTTLGAAGGTIAALFYSWIRYKKPDTPFTFNGALAGLVSVTAGAYVLSPIAAIISGVIGGIIVVISAIFIERILKVDDPVGAVAVHGVAGAWGTLAVGLFGNIDAIGSGLSRIGQIGVQMLGIAAYFVWAAVASIILLSILKACNALRVSEKTEKIGLDAAEHGNESYGGFQIFIEE